MKAVVEPTTCSTPSGTSGRSKASGMALLGRPRRPFPDIVLHSQNQLFNTFKHLIYMYFEFENAWLHGCQ